MPNVNFGLSSVDTPALAAPTAQPALIRPPLRRPLDGSAAGLMVLLCVVWALQQVSLKAVAHLASPLLVLGLRSAAALALLWLLMRWRGEAVSTRRWRAGAVVGLLFGLEYVLVAQALTRTDASRVVVFLYTSPLFAAVGLHLRMPAERLRPHQWAGIGLAFAGLAVAMLGGGADGAPAVGAAAAGPRWWGDGLALLAGAAWGATTVGIRCTSLAQAPATETLFWQLLGAAALLLPAAWWGGHTAWAGGATLWAHLLFQVLVVSLGSFLAWCWLLQRHLATPLGAMSLLTPLFGVLLAAALLGERPGPGFLAGGVTVVLGLLLVHRRPLHPPGDEPS